MATHSSVLAWRIPGTGEPGGLPSMRLQSQTQLKRLNSSCSSSTISVFPMSSTLGAWEEGILCTTATRNELHLRQSSALFLCPVDSNSASPGSADLTFSELSYWGRTTLTSFSWRSGNLGKSSQISSFVFPGSFYAIDLGHGTWEVQESKKKSVCFVHFNTGPLLCV